MKIYLYYLNDRLYAYTDDKSIHQSFCNQRGMSKIDIVKTKIKKKELKEFESFNNELKLYETNIHDGKEYFNIITNIAEEIQVDNFINQLDDKMQSIMNNASRYNLIDTYKDTIKYLTDIVVKEYVGDTIVPLYSVNMISIYIKLFGDTFEKGD